MHTPQPEEPGDNDERDIADDPLLSAISADLQRVTKSTDRTLLVLLLVIVVAFISTVKAMGAAWVGRLGALLGAALIVGVILFTVLRTIRLKRQIGVKYGLVCSSCGYNPGAGNALEAAQLRRCTRCSAALAVSSSGRDGA
jgi:hypothetical protein